MGMLLWKNSNKHIYLRTQTLRGRHARCDIRIDAPKISGHHARLQWVDEGWEVHDLGSRNGTFVDGRRLEPGERITVDRGSLISLGRQAAEFEFVDSSAPGAVAVDVQSGALSFSEGGLLALPNDQNPVATIYSNNDGDWFIEGGESQRSIKDGEILAIQGSTYRIELPNLETETQQSGTNVATLESVALRLGVTPDEEQVEATVRVVSVEWGKRCPCPCPKSPTNGH